MKRGDVSPVFTYILVIIIGAIIILFFTTFAFQQLSLGKRIGSIEIAKTLDDNLNAFAISKSSDKDIEFGLDIKLLINNLVCNTISVDESSNIRTNKIIFSPKSLEGSKIKAWTLAFKYPFHITNFFYLANDKTLYYLIYDGSSQQFVEEKFFDDNSQYKIPARFNIRKVRKSDINNALVSSLITRFDFVKLVYFSTPNIQPRDKLKIIEVEIDNNKATKIKFHNENREDVLVNEEMLLGAIFSNDYESFKCGSDNAINKLKSVSKLYIEKKSKLSIPAKGLTCSYSLITNNLDYFINNNPGLNNINDYEANKNNLIINNNDLEGADKCEGLF